MKILKVVFKVLAIFIVVIIILVIAVVIYFNFYGKPAVEKALSDILGAKIKFASVSLNIDQPALSFKGISIQSKIDLGKSVFNAEKCMIILDEERLKQDKQVFFKHIIIEKGTLNIERNKEGLLSLSDGYLDQPEYNFKDNLAFAEDASVIGFYKFAKYVQELTISDSRIKFKDYYISGAEQPLAVNCDNFNLKISSAEETPNGAIPAKCTADFNILNTRYTNKGEFFLSADMAVYPQRVDMEMTVETKYIDLMQFLPYVEKHTPFSCQEGLFSSTTKFRMHSNIIDSLTTMLFHRLNLIIDPEARNAQFLNTTVNKLAPYLTSKTGDLIFDFVIQGPKDHPEVGIGPQVKFAIGQVVIEELGNFIQQMQKLRQ